MTQIKNNINTYADLTAYNADLNKEYPNISYISGSGNIIWAAGIPRIKAVYNVITTSSTTKILNRQSSISYQEIDGVPIQDYIRTTYQFSTTGEHTMIIEIQSPYSIINSLFSGCEQMVEITIDTGISTIGDEAFAGCSGLTSITIPDTVARIGVSAFQGCTSLTNCTIGNGVTTIGDNAFLSCTGLTSVTIPNTVTSIGNYAFRNVGLVNIDIPNNVTSIGTQAFLQSASLESITIGNGVTNFNGGQTFHLCSNLESIIINSNVPSDFVNSSINTIPNLTSVTIGSGVTSINGGAFKGCTADITVLATNPPMLGLRVFNDSESTIYVPAVSLNAYKTASRWSSYASRIQEIPS